MPKLWRPWAGTPLLYLAIRFLFKFVLKVFYSSIIVENPEFVSSDGTPCILCANHSNSLTDALIMIASIPLAKRRWVRMTAKSTLFGRKTFSSWLIESVGSVPLKRAKDYDNKKVDNSEVMHGLLDALSKQGDMICLFPEGISHYHSYVAPLRNGVARIASDVLQRNAAKPDFKLTLLTCSITYLHREAFRSDVLVRFNEPIELSVRDHSELFFPSASSSPGTQADGVKQLTSLMQEQIRSGTLDSPDFGTIRIANTARRMYAPLGTSMTLGDTVQVTQRFVDVFARQKYAVPRTPAEALMTPGAKEIAGMPTSESMTPSRSNGAATSLVSDDYFGSKKRKEGKTALSDEDIEVLKRDLHAYQDTLNHLGLKDDRIRRDPVPIPILLKRLLVRLSGGFGLLAIASPGIILWLPVFATASFFGWRMRTKGKLEDVWDEIAHTKLIYGLLSGCIVWALAVFFTLPIAPITVVAIPVVMWFSLRWLEDSLSSLRAAVALGSMLLIGQQRLSELHAHRAKLHERVLQAAIERADLPEDVQVFLDKERRREKGGRVGRLGYFSIRRRRKKDYNEVMRLWDKTEFAM